ncbi:MAG TPA: hypothetical protein VJN95_07340 [Gemmatimonadales bacterium]|nr:hypothetical protein [Gemmatimonadales bacterium]
MLHALLLHLLSFSVFASGVIGSVAVYLMFRKAVASAPPLLPGLARMFPVFGIMTSAGLLLMIISGVLLLRSRDWAFWGQSWLTIKLVLIVLLFANAHAWGRPTGARMAQALVKGGMPPAENPEVQGALKSLALFWTVQVIGLVIIVSLAVLKP